MPMRAPSSASTAPGQLDVTYVVPQQQFAWIRQNLPGELHISPQL